MKRLSVIIPGYNTRKEWWVRCVRSVMAALGPEDSIVSYKCGEKFYGEYDDGVMWDDPDLAVAWPLEKIGGIDKVILADKDKNLQSFSKFVLKENGGF